MAYGWLGQHQRPNEHAGALNIVQMGARPYSPALGRFLSVDPVEGGSANDTMAGEGKKMDKRQWGVLVAAVLAMAGLILWLVLETRLGFPLLAAAAAVAIGTIVRSRKG